MKKNSFKKKQKLILSCATVLTLGGSCGFITSFIVTSHGNVSRVSATGEAGFDYVQKDLNPNYNETNRKISYYMVSTGNGLASFLKFSDTDSAIVFDTGIGGPPLSWRSKLYQYNTVLVNELKNAGVKSIDAIFLSHFHTDHYSNLRNILKNFPVKEIIPNLSYEKWQKQFGKDFNKYHVSVEKEIKSNYLVDGIVFDNWSYKARKWMEELKEKGNNKENNKSNMIYFQYYGKKFLISGDAEKQLGNQIIDAEYVKPIDFYQVAHHGSDNALGKDFIDKIKPKYCYIPGTAAPNESDPWYKFIGNATHQFPKASTIAELSKYSNDIRMTGEKPDISGADKINVWEKTLIFEVNNFGDVSESTDDNIVINN